MSYFTSNRSTGVMRITGIHLKKRYTYPSISEAGLKFWLVLPIRKAEGDYVITQCISPKGRSSNHHHSPQRAREAAGPYPGSHGNIRKSRGPGCTAGAWRDCRGSAWSCKGQIPGVLDGRSQQ